MEFILFMMGFAWKLLLIGFGFWAFKWVLGDGKDVIRTIASTIGIYIQTACLKMRKKLLLKLEKEKEPLPEGNSDDPTRVEAHVI